MTLSNAKVLYKHFKEIGRLDAAKQLEERYPELIEVKDVIVEAKKDGKVRKG